MMPKRVRIDWRKPGGKKPANTVVVARPSRWGNPFNWQDVYGSENPRAVVVMKFKNWLKNCGWYGYCSRRQWMLDHIGDLADKDIACYCHLCERHKDGLPIGEYCPDCDPCHGDTLGRIANGIDELI